MSPQLKAWQAAWGVSDLAMIDLRQRLTAEARFTASEGNPAPKSEAAVSERSRLAVARRPDMIGWRNNVGAAETANGRIVRYGLANDSAKMNEAFKSSDHIGIYAHVVRSCDVGRTIGIFWADEHKREDWHYVPSDKRYPPQLNFATLVETYGGIANITNGCVGGSIVDRIEAWKNRS